MKISPKELVWVLKAVLMSLSKHDLELYLASWYTDFIGLCSDVIYPAKLFSFFFFFF